VERDQFLGRVAAARRGATLPDIAGPATAPPISVGDPVARFVTTAGEVGAKVVEVENPEAACQAILHIAAGGMSGLPSPGEFLAWDGLNSIVPGLYDYVIAAGWKRVATTVGDRTRLADHHRAANASIGITGADAAIAATGSVVLTHGPGRPRSASLLVGHHIVLLPADRIVPSLQEALKIADWSMTSNWVAITGPSRTGDIESILTLGVHGPRRVSIVLIG
jgi:L-lactate dehydrogenase complex protein LldG